jgi:hypothetical protein
VQQAAAAGQQGEVVPSAMAYKTLLERLSGEGMSVQTTAAAAASKVGSMYG